MMNLFFLLPLKHHSSMGLLLLRITIGAFLVWGVWDHIVNPGRLHEFSLYLSGFGLPVPQLMARLFVYSQFLAGIGLIVGLLTRWSGVICAVNFAVAVVMVDRFAGIRGVFPSACLTMIGIFLALYGSGRFGLDAFFESKINPAVRFRRSY